MDKGTCATRFEILGTRRGGGRVASRFMAADPIKALTDFAKDSICTTFGIIGHFGEITLGPTVKGLCAVQVFPAR